MRFRDHAAAFEAETGVPVRYIVVLSETDYGEPPTARTTLRYSSLLNLDLPVLADRGQLMPGDGEIPSRCAVSPQMRMIHCYSGWPGARDPALQAIADNAALR